MARQSIHLTNLLLVLLNDYRIQEAEFREERDLARGLRPDGMLQGDRVVGEPPIDNDWATDMQVYERRAKIPGKYAGIRETSPWFYGAQWVCQRARIAITWNGLAAHLLAHQMTWKTDTDSLSLELSRISDEYGTDSLLDELWIAHPAAMERMKDDLKKHTGVEVDEPDAAGHDKTASIPSRASTANSQFEQVKESLGRENLTDREAYDALRKTYEMAGETDDLLSFATWQRYLRLYRQHTQEQKHVKRGGVATSRSIAPVQAIEPHLLPDAIRPRWADK